MAAQTPARVAAVRYRTNVNSFRKEDAAGLALNEIGRVEIETARPLAVDAYQRNRRLGSFILIDRLTNATVAAGMMVDRTPAEEGLARLRAAADAGANLYPQRNLVPTEERVARLGQRPFTIWLTGLPCSGKTSTAFALERALFDLGRHAHVLDGESLRRGISSDLGFSPGDRWENQRRAAEIARLTNTLGMIAVVALVSPVAADREQARRIVGEDRFVEVFCDAPLAVCESRDAHDLYGRARRGEIDHVTGIGAPYEAPSQPDLRLDTAGTPVAGNVALLLEALRRRGLLA
jgi:bifunctional enzyme CysN/CysC